MKRLLWVIAFLMVSSLPSPQLAAAQASTGSDPQPTSASAILCLPGTYLDAPDDCTPAGPSTYLTQMAQKGITLPLVPLSVFAPDPSLTQIDTHYGLVRSQNAPVYASLEDAMRNNKKAAARYISSSFSYISYVEDTVANGKRFYEIEPGAWMTANDVSRIGAIPLYQGVILASTPEHSFGWVLNYQFPDQTQTKRTPGNDQNDYTGHILKNLAIVQVYSVQAMKDGDWYMVGPDEWLPKRFVARVIPNTTPPQGISGERWIEINLYEQTLAVYDQGQMVFATLMASGADPFWTRPGVFQIKQKLASTVMRGSMDGGGDAYYLEDVPWTMYFDGARALHGAYWRAKLGYPQSHGCVNLSVGDAHWLFDWAHEGDWVYVWDPSGKTPTDPKLYSSGGY